MQLRFFFIMALILSFFGANAQSQYEVSPDPKHPEAKMLKGIINKYIIQNDTSFKWYIPSHNSYHPDTFIVNSVKNINEKIHFVLFGGTWCDDTQFILPKFFKLQEVGNLPDSVISFFGVDRQKVSLGNIAEAFAIKNVPTIIVMKEGKELGRVVEYGKTGKWDKELAEILKQ